MQFSASKDTLVNVGLIYENLIFVAVTNERGTRIKGHFINLRPRRYRILSHTGYRNSPAIPITTLVISAEVKLSTAH